MKTLLSVLFLFAIFLPAESQAEEMVSVRLVNYIGQATELDVDLTGRYFTADPTLSVKEGVNYRLSCKKGRFLLEGEGVTQEIDGPFLLIPERYDTGHFVRINGRPYLGAMAFHLEEGQYIRPVNQLTLEDYLKGVVPFEVFPSWNMEALKAQALAARTYAVAHLDKEMDDTIRFQVYGGYAWFPLTSRAVEETKGEVITFRDRLIEAFYSASNGGMTESNAHVWGGEPSRYYPIKPDPYDPVQPWGFQLHETQIDIQHIDWNHPDWWETLEERDVEIASAMKKWLQRKGCAGELKILSIPRFELSEQKNSSRRSVKGSLEMEFMQRLPDGTVLFDKVSLLDVPLSHIRPMIGGTRFKSYLIELLEKEDGVYIMKGKGNGHGVGMSQWGAHVMGEKGKNYREIVQFYFPGTVITTLPN